PVPTSTFILNSSPPPQIYPLSLHDALPISKLCAEVVDEARAKGIDKPVVASLVGDVQVEEASEYLYERGIVAYPYTTELPVAVLGAKYKWARGAGLV